MWVFGVTFGGTEGTEIIYLDDFCWYKKVGCQPSIREMYIMYSVYIQVTWSILTYILTEESARREMFFCRRDLGGVKVQYIITYCNSYVAVGGFCPLPLHNFYQLHGTSCF